jgi:hypothetical protein
VNIEVAALIAHGRKQTACFSEELVESFRDSLYQNGVKLMKRVSGF